MTNIRNSNKTINKLLKNSNFTTKVSIYFSYTGYDDDYDKYENNTIDMKLNPKTIKAYVTEISPDALVYKQYGLNEIGAKEIICEAKYRNWFEKCAKITINEKEFQIFKEAASQRSIITSRPFNLIRVVVSRRDQ